MNTNDKHSFPIQLLKTLGRFSIKYIAILFGMGIIGILLLTLSYCIPVNPTTKDSSLLYRHAMGYAPLVNNRYAQYQSFFTTYEPGILDDSTDLIILKNAFDEGE